MRAKKSHILIIYGPTAVGKTALSFRLAKKFDGEIVSADSRQVYQGMDIGTGKDLPVNAKLKIQNEKSQIKIKNERVLKPYRIDGVPIWMLDVVKLDQSFNVADYTKIASEVIKNITRRKKLPILAGGTGFYLKALLDGVGTLGVKPDWELRGELENLETEKLKDILEKADIKRYQSMNESDRNNPRRLVRAIEIAMTSQKSIRQLADKNQKHSAKLKNYEVHFIALKTSLTTLYQRIDRRVEERVEMGAEEEVRDLIDQGFSWDLPAMSGMGYRQWKPFFEGKEMKEKVIQRWKFDEHNYARRQLTWFKNDKRANWFDISDEKWENKIEKLVSVWLAQKNAKKS